MNRFYVHLRWRWYRMTVLLDTHIMISSMSAVWRQRHRENGGFGTCFRTETHPMLRHTISFYSVLGGISTAYLVTCNGFWSKSGRFTWPRQSNSGARHTATTDQNGKFELNWLLFDYVCSIPKIVHSSCICNKNEFWVYTKIRPNRNRLNQLVPHISIQFRLHKMHSLELFLNFIIILSTAELVGCFFLLRFAAATVMCIVCAPPWNRLKLPSAYTHGAPQCHNRHIRHCQPVEFVERDNEKNASSITFYFVFRCFFFAFLFSVCSSLFGKMGLFVGLFICSSRPVRSATLSRHLLYFVLHIGIIYTQIDIISPESYAKNIQVRFCTLSWHDALLHLTAMDARHQAWAMADGKRAARNCLNDLIRAILVWRCCAMLAACGCCAASNKSE